VEIEQAMLIMHPKAPIYNITPDLTHVFEIGSNFEQLRNPIIDEYGNTYRDSEWYYMAQRTDHLETKKMIAFMSIGKWLAKKASKRYDLEQDPAKRVIYMRNAVTQKFQKNPELEKKLLATGDKEIIEYTARNDRLFGIDQESLTGANALGKLLMEYREKRQSKNKTKNPLT
jgi:predicted NAD-dependent protein-ADP-ribosyltransferase YbiA (DUF1768 family)